jgi:hypothetical protein
MKRSTLPLTTASVLALGFALSSFARENASTSQSAPSSPPAARTMPSAGSHSGQITVATEDARKHLEKKLTDQQVKGSDGRNLGTVDEFLVDSASGKVAYAVVSSGGVGGLGDKKRLMPVSALERGERAVPEYERPGYAERTNFVDRLDHAPGYGTDEPGRYPGPLRPFAQPRLLCRRHTAGRSESAAGSEYAVLRRKIGQHHRGHLDDEPDEWRGESRHRYQGHHTWLQECAAYRCDEDGSEFPVVKGRWRRPGHDPHNLHRSELDGLVLNHKPVRFFHAVDRRH